MRNCIVLVVILVIAGLWYGFGIRQNVSNEEAFEFVARALILDEQLLLLEENEKPELSSVDKTGLAVGCLSSNLSMVVSGFDNFYLFTLSGEDSKTRLIRLDYYRDRTVAGYVSLERYARHAKLKPIISRDIKIGNCPAKEGNN
jgi:hypothetical protein